MPTSTSSCESNRDTTCPCPSHNHQRRVVSEIVEHQSFELIFLSRPHTIRNIWIFKCRGSHNVSPNVSCLLYIAGLCLEVTSILVSACSLEPVSGNCVDQFLIPYNRRSAFVAAITLYFPLILDLKPGNADLGSVVFRMYRLTAFKYIRPKRKRIWIGCFPLGAAALFGPPVTGAIIGSGFAWAKGIAFAAVC